MCGEGWDFIPICFRVPKVPALHAGGMGRGGRAMGGERGQPGREVRVYSGTGLV
jgi:hypothetical protein